MDKENIKRGAFLKSLREDNLYTERDLAELLGVEASDITVWETGIKFPEDNSTIEKLSKILNVSKKELLNGEFSKRNKEIDSYETVERVEEYNNTYKSTNSSFDMKKTIALVVLSCIVLFTLIIAIATLTKPASNIGDDDSTIYVSDERETIVHNPKSVKEHVVHNTQALSGNLKNGNTDLTVFGFTKTSDGKYVKSTNKYRIEFYNNTFYLTIYKSYKNFYAEESVSNRLIKYKTSNRVKSVEVEMMPPYGRLDCDVYNCSNNIDYFKYLNLLIEYIRG